MRGGRNGDRCGQPQGYKYPLGLNGRLWAALLPFNGVTAALGKTVKCRKIFLWLFWQGMRMLFMEYEHLVAHFDQLSLNPP
jgi:hypothetical protein